MSMSKAFSVKLVVAMVIEYCKSTMELVTILFTYEGSTQFSWAQFGRTLS